MKVGDRAPDFTLPTVEPAGTASLADYRGRSPVMLVINRGLWCSFCRRHLAQLGRVRARLEPLGIETLAVVASRADRARFYVGHRPTGVRLAVDPDLVVHRAYGLGMPPPTPELEQATARMRVRLEDIALDPTDLSELRTAVQASGASPGDDPHLAMWDFIMVQRRLYAYDLSEDEQQQWTRNRTLSTGQFLIDRSGTIRWTKVQRVTDAPAGLGNYPGDDEFVAAARALVS